MVHFPHHLKRLAARVDVSKCFIHSASCVQIASEEGTRASVSLLPHKALSQPAKAEGSCRIWDGAAVAVHRKEAAGSETSIEVALMHILISRSFLFLYIIKTSGMRPERWSETRLRFPTWLTLSHVAVFLHIIESWFSPMNESLEFLDWIRSCVSEELAYFHEWLWLINSELPPLCAEGNHGLASWFFETGVLSYAREVSDSVFDDPAGTPGWGRWRCRDWISSTSWTKKWLSAFRN